MAIMPALPNRQCDDQLIESSLNTVSDVPAVEVTLSNGDDKRRNDEDDRDAGVATKTRPKTKKPSLYRVLLLNDDYTPQDFVVSVVQAIFNKSAEEAWEITMHVHNHGVGECGVFPFEVAETKVTLVLDAARKHQHPLQCVMEKQ